MIPRTLWPIALAAFGVLVVILNTFYVVSESQQAIVLRAQAYVATANPPGMRGAGLFVKVPFLDSVIYYDKRNIGLTLQRQQTQTADQEPLEVDAMIRWRIANPRAFFQAVGSQQSDGESRLRSSAESSVKRILGAARLADIISGRRGELMQAIENDLNREAAPELGIQIIDVRIRQADFPEAVALSVFERMRTERAQEAQLKRSEGAEAAQRIRADADRQRVVILATAQEESERTRGAGEAERARIFARAYGRDPEFAAFYRSMRAYETALDQGTPIVVPPDSDFFRYMQNRGGARR